MLGERLGQYHILEQLGAGAMGVVYRARDEKLRREVAIKLLRDPALSQAERRHRVLAEARAAAALNHPAAVTIYDVVEHNDQIFLVMELLEGHSLRQVVMQGRMEAVALARLALQIADALNAANERAIVHGDIKPENILMCSDGRVKLLDFGIARQLRAGADFATLTADSRHLSGTLAYMAPEQVRGEECDHRADLFSLGIVVYELAAGLHPFAGGTPAAVAGNILHQVAMPIAQRVPDVAPEFARIVDRLLERDAAARYPSARELRADLTHWLHSLEQRAELPASVASKPAIAVVPFHLLTPSPEHDYLPVALADAIINELSAGAHWLVRPISTVMRYARDTADPALVARELAVQTVITGSIQRAGDRLRVHAQAWQAQDGRALYSARHDASVSTLFELQDTLASELSRALGVKARPSDQNALPPTTNATAYELFLRAAERLTRLSRWDTRTAIEMLQSAVELDPKFADAWARLASACVIMASSFDPDPKWFRTADRAIRKAVAIDPANAEAECARGRVLWTPAHKFQNRAALRTLNRALAFNPGCYPALCWRGLILLHLGLLDQARATLQQAIAINPDDALALVFLGQVAMYGWKHDEAREYHDRALHIDPTHLWGRIFAPTAEIYGGDFAAAEQRIRAAHEVLPNDPWLTSCEALLWAKRGENKRAEQALRQALKPGVKTLLHTHHMWHTAACAYALLRKPAPAVALLGKCVALGLPNYPLFRDEPHLVNLQSNPAYQKLMAKLQREWQKYQTEFGQGSASSARAAAR